MNKTVYLILLSASLMLLSACGEFNHQRQRTAASPAPVPGKAVVAKAPQGTTGAERQKVMKVARDLLGTPYRYGGTTPRKGFDCSGFTSWVFRQVGVQLPRTAAAQYQRSHRIRRAELKVGDLLFFKIDGRKISHVAIYAGDDRFIHAPSSGKKVSFGTLDNPYWIKHWVGSGRYL